MKYNDPKGYGVDFRSKTADGPIAMNRLFAVMDYIFSWICFPDDNTLAISVEHLRQLGVEGSTVRWASHCVDYCRVWYGSLPCHPRPDLGFIRDVGKDGWIVPTIDQVIGGVRNADMIQVNSENVVIGLTIDDGPWEVRIGLVGETTGTTVEIVTAKPAATYTMLSVNTTITSILTHLVASCTTASDFPSITLRNDFVGRPTARTLIHSRFPHFQRRPSMCRSRWGTIRTGSARRQTGKSRRSTRGQLFRHLTPGWVR
ncbi:hypothetical protein ER16_Medium4 [Pseudomonas phage ER16]|nr:hypothetical protein ER16_Medium4 [Pseudomonas phage ER16]